jgi:tetratricopeptide (TPR) repeat protein
MSSRALTRSNRLAILAASFAVGVFGVGLAPSADGDVFWHLAAGREMAATGSLLRADPFSVSAAGRPWIDVHWLFEVLIHAVYSWSGLLGLVLVKCALTAGSALLLFEVVRRRAGSRALLPFALTFLLSLFAARHLLLLRPVIGTLALLAAFVAVLELSRRSRSERWLLLLLPLQIIWSNLQGLSALGPAVVLCYGGGSALAAFSRSRLGVHFRPEAESERGESRRALVLGATLLGCVAASFVTPYGLAAVELPFRLLARLAPEASNVFSANVVENAPPLSLEREGSGEFWHLRIFLALALFAFAARPRRLVLSHCLLLTVFGALALIASRNVLLLYWVMTPFVVEQLMPKLRRLSAALPARGRVFARASSAVAFIGLVGLVGTAAAEEPSLGAPAPFRVPARSAEILARTTGDATVFAADHYGGYLIWKLHPRYRPYIDTRLILRTAEEYSEFLAVIDHPERFDAFERRHGFGYVVLPTAYPDRYLGLIAHLYASDRFRLVHTDGSEVLFARRGSNAEPSIDLASPRQTDVILAELDARFGGSPEVLASAQRKLATLAMAVGELDQAERVLRQTKSPESEALLARCRLARGDYAGASAIAESVLRSDPDDVPALNVLALAALSRGEADSAATALGRALKNAPFDVEARGILKQLEDHHHVDPR